VPRELHLLPSGYRECLRRPGRSGARILGDWLINGKDPLPNIAKLSRGGQGN
jgi:hypothetical protein